MTLLIQLFGRAVIDQIAAAGFDTGEAIARAGAERLSIEGSIPPDLARRIVAVALEAQASSAPKAEETEVPAPRRKRGGDAAARAERHVRRPLPRPGSARASAPPAPAEPRTASPSAPEEAADGRPAPAPAVETVSDRENHPLDADPFIDDVALISWMGFNARGGAGPSVGFSVADAILDPPPAPAGAPAPGAEREPTARPADSTPSAEPAARPAEMQPAAPQTTLPGSFWSFGAKRPALLPESAPQPERAGAPPPRRRLYDER